jgi:hypothetical protein
MLYYDDINPESLGLNPRDYINSVKIEKAPNLWIRSGRVIRHWSTPSQDDDFIISVSGVLKSHDEVEQSNSMVFRLFSDGAYDVHRGQFVVERGPYGLNTKMKYDKIPAYTLASDFWEKAYNSARNRKPEFTGQLEVIDSTVRANMKQYLLELRKV